MVRPLFDLFVQPSESIPPMMVGIGEKTAKELGGLQWLSAVFSDRSTGTGGLFVEACLSGKSPKPLHNVVFAPAKVIVEDGILLVELIVNGGA